MGGIVLRIHAAREGKVVNEQAAVPFNGESCRSLYLASQLLFISIECYILVNVDKQGRIGGMRYNQIVHLLVER